DIHAVHAGGIDRVRTSLMDATRLGLGDRSVDVVTVLEVLEHLPRPGLAVAEALRVARRCVVASVPSHEDDNPEHIHLFTRRSLEELFASAGAARVRVESVLNHLVLVARVAAP